MIPVAYQPMASTSQNIGEMEFHPQANQVEFVICPARIDDSVADKARAIAEKVSKAFQHVGLLSV